MQSVICLWVRQAKNALPHPALPGQSFPLQALADRDQRSSHTNFWQSKLTGLTAITVQDIATLTEILPGALPPEREIHVFLEVAQKRIAPPSDWGWPDS